MNTSVKVHAHMVNNRHAVQYDKERLTGARDICFSQAFTQAGSWSAQLPVLLFESSCGIQDNF